MTIQIHSAKAAKSAARVMQRSLAEQDIKVPLGQALDMVSRMAGAKDWNSLAARFDPEAILKALADFEREHMVDSGAANGTLDYGAEAMVVVHNGFQLRYPLDDFVTYVRVCDPLGREIMHWSSDEWEEDPECTMGGILKVLARYEPVELPATKASGKGKKARGSARSPNVSDDQGPFLVLADGGEYDELERFARAREVADFLFDESAEASVEVLDRHGTVVYEKAKS